MICSYQLHQSPTHHPPSSQFTYIYKEEIVGWHFTPYDGACWSVTGYDNAELENTSKRALDKKC